ncbi:MAG: hypothetical protein D6707_05870 [Bacteroidetes bacterium]|nr:MAG: hypothetical protein D6707_05870 [Bacteroidota bacterium]
MDDRNIKVLKAMTKDIFGKFFGNRGYISKALSKLLFQYGIQLITKARENMKVKTYRPKIKFCCVMERLSNR